MAPCGAPHSLSLSRYSLAFQRLTGHTGRRKRKSLRSRFAPRAMSDVTRILQSIESGDPQASGELLPLLYNELRLLAARKMAREAPGQTLQPTALVHEAWLRMMGQKQQNWQSRAHFRVAAAAAMPRSLREP